jgi:hypothetical protein
MAYGRQARDRKVECPEAGERVQPTKTSDPTPAASSALDVPQQAGGFRLADGFIGRSTSSPRWHGFIRSG